MSGLVGSAQVETTLLALKIAFLVLLYLFIWRIVRSAARDVRAPQESMILSPQQASSLLPQPAPRELGRLVVLESPALTDGEVYALDSRPLTVGRGTNNDLPLAGDEYASGRHARFESRRDGVWLEDIGSTNGTFVNGIRADARAPARTGRRRADRRDRSEVRVVITITQSFGSTDTGRKRRRNEDAFVCEPPLFAVADGMGGAQAGEVASGLAASALRESGANGGGERRVAQLIQEANRRVHDRATSDAAASGMGTTITAALFEPDGRVSFGHVGDSRAYLLRDGRLDQLTDDHSLVAELVRRGELSPQEAEVHPQRSVITRALGTDPDVDVDTFSIDARSGDVFLICSDGLSSYVDGSEIEQLVSQNRRDLEAAAKTLIQAANRGGGDDNITAVLFAVGGGEPEERHPRVRGRPGVPRDRPRGHAAPGGRRPGGLRARGAGARHRSNRQHRSTDNMVMIPAATIVGSLPAAAS